jgi:hypothetical protein
MNHAMRSSFGEALQPCGEAARMPVTIFDLGIRITALSHCPADLCGVLSFGHLGLFPGHLGLKHLAHIIEALRLNRIFKHLHNVIS